MRSWRERMRELVIVRGSRIRWMILRFRVGLRSRGVNTVTSKIRTFLMISVRYLRYFFSKRVRRCGGYFLYTRSFISFTIFLR